ncbi:MAG: hypothetical protein FJY29_05540 [Betaproteobacteria bacterium]|nr:hypothetical protein [Betaproteobacteria bacterium]
MNTHSRIEKCFHLKKVLLISGVLLALNLPIQTSAQTSSTAADLGGPITLSSELKNDIIYNLSKKGTVGNDAGLDIVLSAEITKQIILNLKMELGYSFNEKEFSSGALEELLTEAYIEVKNVGGKNVAFIVGKHPIAFGGDLPTLPNGDTDLDANTREFTEIIGLTVQLSDLGVFDLVELSGFESGAGDLTLGSINGTAIRVSKEVLKDLSVTASSMTAKGSSDREWRGSVGFIYESGKWTTWSEGQYLSGNAEYPDANYVVKSGLSYGESGNKITVGATAVENYFSEVGIGYEYGITQNATFGPQIRYRKSWDLGTDEFIVEARTTIRFDGLTLPRRR